MSPNNALARARWAARFRSRLASTEPVGASPAFGPSQKSWITWTATITTTRVNFTARTVPRVVAQKSEGPQILAPNQPRIYN
jgi:hypothetical protein